MYEPQKRNHLVALGLSTAMTAAMLSGCATGTAPRAEVSAAQAQQALANGQTSRAIAAAEAAVAADPRNAGYRMTLGNAYLEAGRFASASTTFEDAMALGENSPRAALSLALALNGQARFAEAADILFDWESQIAPADLGLALALAGQPERGIHVLTNVIRGGDNTVKSRQNLAYAYAVAGRWREARTMAAQDVPAGEVGARMTEWAAMAHADAYQQRIASLLGVPASVRDAGQPVALALANTPGAAELAMEAAPAPGAAPVAAQASAQAYATPSALPLPPVQSARVAVPASGSELPAVGAPVENRYAVQQAPVSSSASNQAPARATFAQAFAGQASSGGSLASAATDTMRSANGAALQPAPARAASAAPRQLAEAPRRVAERPPLAQPRLATPSVAAPSADPTHLVQLGSFASEAGARRAWGIYQSRYPELAEREMVITQAVVNGRNYWRVSAGGFDRASSRAMCGRVSTSGGDGCISWAASSPLPGAIDRGGVRLARR